ncbi:MAG TPA: PAS domain-containing protein [Ferrovibrio sp.]|uniref:PAS domain-containing protein n=1 Tax=Ferrovibrio sp. TaxID=1917215 RepID=UPI002B4B6822|nr:PAS domain-containing protein [Ferrovibrio sp.]HLT77760.1 PAS domain-containing protein [Ferrovibrio sp.]
MQSPPSRRPLVPDPGHRIFQLRLDRQLRAARPALVELVKLWYLRRSDGPLPPRSAFDAQALKAYLPHLFISEYEPDTRRYRYRLIGTAVTELFGRNVTGCYFDEIYCAPDLKDLRDIHDAARLAGEPRTVSGRIGLFDRARVSIEALMLPLAVSEGQNPQILGALYVAEEDDLRPQARAAIAISSAY